MNPADRSCVCVSGGWSAEADVNAGQNFCSSKRKRRRFVVATGSPAASDFRYYLLYRFLSYCAIVSYQDARASDDTALSSPYWDLLATMCRVVNYHSSWARQRQVELFVASGNPGFTAGRSFNPAGGVPGGG
ncbi:putative receptor-like protein kinase [Dorcoceras hygrometricum]|uniref:Putative receptor-like protein kinase n=1 Tax=Dorcoceras hygrometricum TaxID=472368 RepID=A0A2Z7AQA1_9LAMI|nr:putative receptor-like protein kinase [Dorcoceras hygrometricum]